MNEVVTPGSVLGVLGGGQLGRMFALAARSMGYRVNVLTPEEDSPTGQIAHRTFLSDYDDLQVVAEFAKACDAVTYEFENIPAPTVEAVSRHAPVHPNGALLEATQERSREKAALVGLGLPVARHALLESEPDLDPVRAVGFPGVLKTAAFGYDGKGQVRVERGEDLVPAWETLGRARAVYEALVHFEAELSVVAARGVQGECAFYGPFLNQHSNHILDLTSFPAPVSEATRAEALDIARSVLEGFDVRGVLCVELFLLSDGALLVNEVAPRPHNSGHVTIDTHVTSQFEQQVRALCGLPLGESDPLAPAGAMANLLGDLWSGGEPKWEAALGDASCKLHLYGKAEARPGRKMGHLSLAASSLAEAEARARRARERLLG